MLPYPCLPFSTHLFPRAFGDRSLLCDFHTLLPAAPGSCSTAVANASAGPISPWVGALGTSTAAACPMDITETQDAYELTADAPGMDQSNIDIQLHEGMLTIKGHRQLAKEEKDAEGRVVRRERTMSHFTRHFTLPDNVDQEGVTASLDKGVLTLRLPKVTPPPKPEPKRITVAAAPVAAPQAVEAAPAGAELPAAAPAAAPEAGGSA